MTRSILCGLLGLISVATVGALPLACQSGGVGDPCIPEDEFQADFAGFKVTEENIESRSFQCATRICLVNHFQGRASCPLGQPSPKGGSTLQPNGLQSIAMQLHRLAKVHPRMPQRAGERLAGIERRHRGDDSQEE